MRKTFFNEWYPNGPSSAPGAISMTKIKNALKKGCGYSTENCHNVRVNGQLRGCSGFVRKDGSDKIVYFNTEYITSLGRNDDRLLVRYAKSTRDYCGEQNRYCSFETFLRTMDAMFAPPPLLG